MPTAALPVGGSGGRGAALLLVLALAVAVVVPVVFGDAPQDDSYISYVYARNFARGNGLVFNAGEPAVEGYTNYLWTVGIGWGMRAGLDPEQVVPWVGLVLTLSTVLGTYLLARRLGSTPWFAGLGALLFATRPTLAVHAMGGLETPLFGLLVLLGVLAWLSPSSGRSRSGLPRVWVAPALLGLAALTRPEGILVYGLLELFELGAALRKPRELGAFMRRACVRSVPFVLVVGLHLAWRRATYGDWVPNTFHAKVSAGIATWAAGLAYVGWGLLYFGPLFFLLPYCVRPTDAFRRNHLLCLWVSGALSVYVVSVGGDYIPSFRFLWPMMPLWSALAAATATRLAVGSRQPGRPRAQVAVSVLMLVLLVGHTASEYLFGHRWKGMHERHAELVAAGRKLNEILPADAWIAATNAGRLPYFADRRTLDMMGLSDAHIARREAVSSNPVLAGHLKGDGDYVLDCAPEAILFVRLVVFDRPLALAPGWRKLARAQAFSVSEREITFDPRFTGEYRAYSLPLMQHQDGRKAWLNVFARDGVFDENRPPGMLVEERGG